MMTALFWASLSVLIIASTIFVLAPCVPGGPVSAACFGGAAVFAFAGFDQSPPTWLVGFTASLAGGVLWAWAKWVVHLRRQRRAGQRNWMNRL